MLLGDIASLFLPPHVAEQKMRGERWNDVQYETL